MVDKENEEYQEENPESKVDFLQTVFCQDFHRKVTKFFFQFTIFRPRLLTFCFLVWSCQHIFSFLANFAKKNSRAGTFCNETQRGGVNVEKES